MATSSDSLSLSETESSQQSQSAESLNQNQGPGSAMQKANSNAPPKPAAAETGSVTENSYIASSIPGFSALLRLQSEGKIGLNMQIPEGPGRLDAVTVTDSSDSTENLISETELAASSTKPPDSTGPGSTPVDKTTTTTTTSRPQTRLLRRSRDTQADPPEHPTSTTTTTTFKIKAHDDSDPRFAEISNSISDNDKPSLNKHGETLDKLDSTASTATGSNPLFDKIQMEKGVASVIQKSDPANIDGIDERTLALLDGNDRLAGLTSTEIRKLASTSGVVSGSPTGTAFAGTTVTTSLLESEAAAAAQAENVPGSDALDPEFEDPYYRKPKA